MAATAAATRQAEIAKFFTNNKRAGGAEWENALLDNARRVSEPLAAKMLDQMGLTENTNTPFKLLENACGVGVVAPVLQRTIKPEVMKQSSILCGDFSEQALALAKQRIESEGWVNTEARVIDAQVRVFVLFPCCSAQLMAGDRKMDWTTAPSLMSQLTSAFMSCLTRKPP
jgi:hypothetical protein